MVEKSELGNFSREKSFGCREKILGCTERMGREIKENIRIRFQDRPTPESSAKVECHIKIFFRT